MKKFCITLTLLLPLALCAQKSLSFYHLGDATFQNSNINPAYTPDARFYFGLPVLSGVHLNINNKFSYNDLVLQEGGTSTVSISNLISELQGRNMGSMHLNMSLFHVGYHIPKGPAITLFANERVETDLLYPRSLVEFVWEGNGTKLGEEVNIGSTGIVATHFREYGLGASMQVTDQLRVGARLKYLQGFSNVSTPGNFDMTLEVNPQTYAWIFEGQNAQLRTAGIANGTSYNDVSHFLSPGNTGFAMDLGFEYQVHRYLGFAVSVVDLGYISWNTNIQNRVFQDTTFTYDGVNVKDANLFDALQDSLLDRFSTTRNSDSYTTFLPVTAYGSVIWKSSDRTHFIGSVGSRLIQGQVKMLYGGGVRQYFGPFVGSLNVIKMPQQFFNVGAALAVRGGPVQYYLAVDQAINFSVPDAQALDFRMGLNFMVGRSSASSSDSGPVNSYNESSSRSNDPKGISTGSFLGVRVKNRGREGIYSIIPRQNRRDVPESTEPPRYRRRRARVRTSRPPRNQTLPGPRRRY